MSFPHSLKSMFATAGLLLGGAVMAADSADDLIKQGDLYELKFQAADALKCYLPVEKLQPKNVHLLLLIARQYRHLMSDAANGEEKLRLGGVALDYARRAATIAPNDAEAQLSVAISYGKMLPFEGKRDQVEGSRQIKSAVDRALMLDPRNDLAWHVLGRWHQVLADVGTVKRTLGQFIYGSLPTTTNEDAVKCFEQAIKLNPNRLRHYIELGRTYAQMDRPADARLYIAKGLAMPDAEKDDPETKRRGRETLAKLH
jgi:tetratricopeptide (TPR) repeat protein